MKHEYYYNLDMSPTGWIKSSFYVIVGLISSSLNYIGVKNDIVGLLAALIVIDYITGIWKAWKFNVKITSKRSSRGILEKTILLIIPLLIGAVSKILGYSVTTLVQPVFAMICLSELYSIIGNLTCIYSGENKEEIDAVTYVLKKIKDLIFKKIDNNEQ
jgi:toxin secretion/phage lysis holin